MKQLFFSRGLLCGIAHTGQKILGEYVSLY